MATERGATTGGDPEAWADAIEGRETHIARGYDGAVGVAAVEAAYRSAQTRAEAPVELGLEVTV